MNRLVTSLLLSLACTGALAVAAAAPRMTPDLYATITRELIRAGVEITQIWGGQPPVEGAAR